MKPILIAVALLASTFTKSFAANDPIVQPTVLKSFKSTFTNATAVAWSLSQDLYKAEFSLNNQQVSAYYYSDGTLAVLMRHVPVASLPIMLQTKLKKDYKKQWVTDVLEVSSDSGLQYYVTLEDANIKLVLKSAVNTWSLFQKERKE